MAPPSPSINVMYTVVMIAIIGILLSSIINNTTSLPVAHATSLSSTKSPETTIPQSPLSPQAAVMGVEQLFMILKAEEDTLKAFGATKPTASSKKERRIEVKLCEARVQERWEKLNDAWKSVEKQALQKPVSFLSSRPPGSRLTRQELTDLIRMMGKLKDAALWECRGWKEKDSAPQSIVHGMLGRKKQRRRCWPF
ncbi:uncharacterized protein K452DRAFT_343977 [Aplosporella prunicola CBS 121167]|uniref:Uncharacterized protein n=1 Tax=Aplosporella prunicola CBS 121167 TaxID=1176127 RepID=A0A6A6B0W9_9PEZI|nr:uncharacterized protein K452DRAFT_343977 [Aplosporella prunicola CBS 121167]KAF2136371.1 hypothetical protein K452DRAFT_343977 [Aplosporella prunicola CBS 121167]